MSGGADTTELTIREAGDDDIVPAIRVIEGALLDVESESVRERAAEGDVLVAERNDSVVGAIVLGSDNDTDRADRTADSAHILAIAVTRQRRGSGIGTALVDAAADRHARLTADFRPEVKGFWGALGFEIGDDKTGTDRLFGVRK